MLDLVVERAVPEVGRGAGAHVAGGKHLRPQEVELGAVVQLRHPLVVGREDGGHVEPAGRLVYHHHEEGEPGAEEEDQQAEVETCVQDQQRDLQPAPARFRRGQVHAARDVHAQPEQEKHREEGEGLIGGQPAHRAAPLERLLAVVGDGQVVDVRVVVDMVRVRVVAVVLVHPPAVAHPKQQVAGQVADQVVERVALEHLLVPGVVELEAELARDQPESDRVQRDQPRIPEEDQQDEAESEHRQVGRDAEGVVPGLLSEQAGFLDPAFQECVVGPLLGNG